MLLIIINGLMINFSKMSYIYRDTIYFITKIHVMIIDISCVAEENMCYYDKCDLDFETLVK